MWPNPQEPVDLVTFNEDIKQVKSSKWNNASANLRRCQ